MSSGDSFLNIISISAVKDFVGWRKTKPVSKDKAYKMIRIATFVFGITALFMALVFPNIVDLLIVGISTITIFAPVTLFALLAKNPFLYRKIVLISLLFAFVVNLVFFIIGILHPEIFNAKSSFVPSIIIETIILLAGMLFIKKPEHKNT
jgi:Na+/proline symporter